LQEPLRTISNFAGLIEEKYAGKTDKDTDEYLTYILNSTEKMKELIKDLMNFTRIEKDRKYVSVDCNLILKEVISDMQTEIKNSGAIITVSHLPIVTGDYKMLKQLFANLIENSIKFRKKNVAPQIRISAEEKENEFLFKVEDNGIGIDEQHIKKLFNIFQRLHNADEYPGTGIGLATAKKIVNLHNGRIWIESKLGEGCKMHFTIHKEQLKIIT
jgi:light-regulated signal transduction histidine kinase (bacteriophytochrome)